MHSIPKLLVFTAGYFVMAAPDCSQFINSQIATLAQCNIVANKIDLTNTAGDPFSLVLGLLALNDPATLKNDISQGKLNSICSNSCQAALTSSLAALDANPQCATFAVSNDLTASGMFKLLSTGREAICLKDATGALCLEQQVAQLTAASAQPPASNAPFLCSKCFSQQVQLFVTANLANSLLAPLKSVADTVSKTCLPVGDQSTIIFNHGYVPSVTFPVIFSALALFWL
jgi:hypothetical protein